MHHDRDAITKHETTDHPKPLLHRVGVRQDQQEAKGRIFPAGNRIFDAESVGRDRLKGLREARQKLLHHQPGVWNPGDGEFVYV